MSLSKCRIILRNDEDNENKIKFNSVTQTWIFYSSADLVSIVSKRLYLPTAILLMAGAIQMSGGRQIQS